MNYTTGAKAFHIRSFQQPDDVSRLLVLLQKAEEIDHSGDDISEAALQQTLDVPNHDPQKDRWVVEHPDDPNLLIGHGAIWHADHNSDHHIAEVSLVVHPEWRQQGLGSKLFSALLYRAKQLDANDVRLYANPHDIPAVSFLTKHHFSPVSAYTEMRLTDFKQTSSLDSNFSIVSYAALKEPALLVTAYNTCFANQWGHHQVSLEVIEQSLPFIDGEGFFLLFAPDHTLIGMCRSELSVQRSERNAQATGYIDAPGVIPARREPHVYGALLDHAVSWLQEKGTTIIELESWGDEPDIIALYQAHGFTLLRQQYAYQRPLKQAEST